jgi:hypothetical protein
MQPAGVIRIDTSCRSSLRRTRFCRAASWKYACRLAGSKTIPDFAQAIINRPPVGWETTGDPETWPEQWATESLPIAESALTDIEFGDATKTNSPGQKPKCTWPVTLPRAYTQWANQQALTQLGKAGFRLSAIIRAIFEEH